jgi:IclR family acetate operon transcriptional repressor
LTQGGKVGGTDVLVLVKALRILETLAADKKAGLAQVTQQAGVSKPAAFRILSTLERHGYVERVEDTRQYRRGPQLLRLSLLFSAGIDIATIATPYMRELQVRYGETVNLGVLSGTKVVYVNILEGTHGLRMSAEVGSVHDLHSTALGLAILSRLSPKQVRTLVTPRGLVRLTPKTLTKMPEVLAELEATRERGYAVDDEFNEVGARCVAVAIDMNGAYAAISLSGPTSRMTDRTMAAIGKDLIRIAREIEAVLGQGGSYAGHDRHRLAR